MTNKLQWADNLRALSTISVILLHVAALMLKEYQNLPTSSWWIGNICDGLVRYCVPIFLMLTGALLYRKNEDLSVFIKRRFVRVLLPFFCWTFVYILLQIYDDRQRGYYMPMDFLGSFIGKKFQFGAWYHLWYVYLLIGIYLVVPIIKKWISSSGKKEVHYFLIIWLTINVLDIPFLRDYLPAIELRYFSGFLGFTVLGYYLTYMVDLKSNFIPWLLFLSGTIFTILITGYLTTSTGEFDGSWYDYLRPNVISASTGLFLLFRNKEFRSKKLNSWIGILNKHIYGVYLSHVFVLYFLAKIGLDWSWIHPLLGIPFTVIVCLILSLATTVLIHKLPFGKFISG